MNRTMKNWYAAAAVAAGLMIAPVAASAQTIGLEAQQQQARAERERKEAQKAANRQEQQTDKQERRELKREREQLNNMPEAPRKALRAATQGASNIDYYRVPDQKPPQFGAQFTAADGKQYDLRVDRQGNVLSRNEVNAQASAQAPIQPAQTPAPATPAPAPTTPAPGSATASADAPESGNAIY